MLSSEYKREIKKSIELAIPIVVAQLGVVLMAVSDNIMIGRFLGTESLASAGLANSLTFLISSLAVGGFPVIAPIVSKHLAAKNSNGLRITFYASLILAIIYSVVLTLISFILYLNFEILGQTAVVQELSNPFFLIISLSNIPLFFFLSIKQTTDGVSLPNGAMVITFFGLALNILLNYYFINGFQRIPAFGLNGAAYSTLLVRIIMLLALIIFAATHPKIKPIVRFRQIFSEVLPTVKHLLRLSIPGGLQFFFEIGAFATAVIMMGWIGADALAAHQIAISVAATTYMMASGIAFSGGIRVGHALGLKDSTQVIRSANVAFFLGIIFMTLSMLIILFLREQLAWLYIEDMEIVNLVKPLLAIAAIFQLSDGIQVVALGNLRGISDVKVPAYITLIAYWGLALPLGYYLAFNLELGASGIWYALLIGLSFAAVFLTLRFYNLVRLRKI